MYADMQFIPSLEVPTHVILYHLRCSVNSMELQMFPAYFTVVSGLSTAEAGPEI